MSLQYSCFISYPHGQDKVMEPFVKAFANLLKTEVGAQTRKRIWLDLWDLKVGYRVDGSIGADLCNSVCLVVIYTPLYFDKEHTYCAQEFRAMELLEAERLRLLPSPANKHYGLIIPVIVRGLPRLPNVIKNRKYAELIDIELANPPAKLRRRYGSEIRKIADYIVDCCVEFDLLQDDVLRGCDNFLLPSSAAVASYLESMRDPFPGAPTEDR